MTGNWRDDPRHPKVMIALPARNEEVFIGRALKSIGNQDYPRERFRVVVVDNQSTDGTRAIVDAADDVDLVSCPGTISQVRNEGIRRATGDLVAFVDSDCIVPEDWLSRAVEHFRDDPEVVIVSSIMKLENVDSSPWVERLWIENHRARYRADVTPTDTISSFCFLIDRAFVEKIGGFNDELTSCEDSDLGFRISQAGGKILVDSRIEVIHLGNAKTLKALFMRQLWQGGSNVRNLRSHRPDPSEYASLIVPLVFVCGLLLAPLLLLIGHPILALAILGAVALLPLAIAIVRSPIRDAAGLFGYWRIWATYLAARGLGTVVTIDRSGR